MQHGLGFKLWPESCYHDLECTTPWSQILHHDTTDPCAWMLQGIAEICAVCNEARIEGKGGLFKAVGAPTEAALVVLAEKIGWPDAAEQAAVLKARKADLDDNCDAVCRLYASR